MTGRFIGTTYKEYQRKCIENCKYYKQIDDSWTCKNVKKRPQAPKPILLGLGSEKSGNQIPNLENFEKYEKDAPGKTVQDGSSTFANELTRFRNEAKPIWVKIQKHCKNAVII